MRWRGGLAWGTCCPRHGMVCMARQQVVMGVTRVCRVAMAALAHSSIGIPWSTTRCMQARCRCQQGLQGRQGCSHTQQHLYPFVHLMVHAQRNKLPGAQA